VRADLEARGLQPQGPVAVARIVTGCTPDPGQIIAGRGPHRLCRSEAEITQERIDRAHILDGGVVRIVEDSEGERPAIRPLDSPVGVHSSLPANAWTRSARALVAPHMRRIVHPRGKDSTSSRLVGLALSPF
jgi:hypothetical protein